MGELYFWQNSSRLFYRLHLGRVLGQPLHFPDHSPRTTPLRMPWYPFFFRTMLSAGWPYFPELFPRHFYSLFLIPIGFDLYLVSFFWHNNRFLWSMYFRLGNSPVNCSLSLEHWKYYYHFQATGSAEGITRIDKCKLLVIPVTRKSVTQPVFTPFKVMTSIMKWSLYWYITHLFSLFLCYPSFMKNHRLMALTLVTACILGSCLYQMSFHTCLQWPVHNQPSLSKL